MRDPTWKIVTESRLSDLPDFRVTIVPLKRIRTFLQDLAEEFSNNFAQVGLTRETKTTVAQRVVFSATLSEAIHDIFGKWLDDVVAAFTEVAFDIEVTVDQIKSARRNAAQRRVRTEASKG
jgi:superfamily II DNA/RNA helicase